MEQLSRGAYQRRCGQDERDALQLLLLVNRCCRSAANLHGGRYDASHPSRCSGGGGSSSAARVLEMFVIVINILSGSGVVSDTQAWRGLIIKRSYCGRWPGGDTRL